MAASCDLAVFNSVPKVLLLPASWLISLRNAAAASRPDFVVVFNPCSLTLAWVSSLSLSRIEVLSIGNLCF